MSSEGTGTTDRQCSACQTGVSFSSVDSSDACQPVTTCKPGEYEHNAPSPTEDRGCSTHSASCPSGQFTFTAPTDHADRVCRAITVCVAGKYEAMAPGASSDRVCGACTTGTFKATSGNQACVAWRRRAGAGREYRGAPGSARCLRSVPRQERLVSFFTFRAPHRGKAKGLDSSRSSN